MGADQSTWPAASACREHSPSTFLPLEVLSRELLGILSRKSWVRVRQVSGGHVGCTWESRVVENLRKEFLRSDPFSLEFSM